MENEKSILRKTIEIFVVFIISILMGVAGYLVHRVDAVTDELHRVDKYAAVTDAKLVSIEAKIDILIKAIKASNARMDGRRDNDW